MKIYYENGYVNIGGILEEGFPFNFIVGGRGTGKTYDALHDAIENNKKFMLMRRTQSQCDLVSKPEFSVFKPLNVDFGWNIESKKVSKYNSMFYTQEAEQIIVHGYSCALSTISNMRGFDASDIEELIYDEFIPEKHERLFSNEAEAVLNAYETMNRNRELKGKKPIQALFMANANDITNPLFEYLNLIRIADKMQKGGSERWTDEKRGIQLIMLHRSPISKKKSQTVLYNLTNGSEFSSMALANDFNVERQHIKSRPLVEYIPACKIGELCIYKHKSERKLYATTHQAGTFKKVYRTTDTDKMLYRSTFMHHYDLYIERCIDFEDVLSEKLFLKYWDE